MGNDFLDMSVGLEFGLPMLERYQKSGLLQAEIRYVPGIRGYCLASISLSQGKVISCFIEKNGQKSPIEKDVLIRVDAERGPFEWKFKPLPVPSSSSPRVDFSVIEEQQPLRPKIPKKRAALELERLVGWTTTQKHVLSTVYNAIDGRKTVEDIKREVPLPPEVIEDVLRILLELKVMII